MTAQEETLDATKERVLSALDGLTYELATTADGMLCVELDRSRLHDALARLRDRAAFEALTFITGIDRLSEHEVEPRFDVVHQLQSIVHADRVRLRTRVTSTDAAVPTCTDLWPGAGFMERECWDMFGIVFDGNPDLRRLLLPDGYGHHPLRKEFPHQGIEPDRLYREWDRKRRETWTNDANDAAQRPS